MYCCHDGRANPGMSVDFEAIQFVYWCHNGRANPGMSVDSRLYSLCIGVTMVGQI